MARSSNSDTNEMCKKASPSGRDGQVPRNNSKSLSSFRLRCLSLNMLRLRRIFDLFEKNRDGVITVEEWGQALNLLGLDAQPCDLDSMIRSFIQPGNPGLQFDDFQALHRSLDDTFFTAGEEDKEKNSQAEGLGNAQEESDLTEAFKVFDEDGDGYISAQELQVVLSKLGIQEAHEMDRRSYQVLTVSKVYCFLYFCEIDDDVDLYICLDSKVLHYLRLFDPNLGEALQHMAF
ncbi:LOW QUALITY PROTEIN: EF-hand domain [Dillenia turbinata]|uniref:EF-hand domain n=1 Tax=Dillenia turbinata TaxID=194707 RepID=A0AAN8VYU4_9MAGN